MNNQDFEAYAKLKPFNTKIADTWLVVALEAVNGLGGSVEKLCLLDYGCGDGKYFSAFVSQGFVSNHIYGVEVSKNRIARCNEIGWQNVELLVPNAPLPFADGKFDLINMMEVIEHILASEGECILEELRRVLKPGGYLLISTPNYPIKRFYDIFNAIVYRMHVRWKDDPTHVTKFNYNRLETLLMRHFASVESRVFKPGFLYNRFPYPFFQHKLFFLCRA